MLSKQLTPEVIAFRIWMYTVLIVSFFSLFWAGPFAILVLIVATVCSFPVLIALWFILYALKKARIRIQSKFFLLVLACFFSTLPYGMLGPFVFSSYTFNNSFFWNTLLRYMSSSGILFLASMIAIVLLYKKLYAIFYIPSPSDYSLKTNTMETLEQPIQATESSNHSNKVLIKAAITAALILALLIPALFVSNLVTERANRQNEVVNEVTGKWADPQTITGPYLSIPYSITGKDQKGNPVTTSKNLILLPDQLQVNGKLIPEIRPRSIYKVLLYKSEINATGSFHLEIPKDIDPTTLNLAEAKICLGISDFKGIEDRLLINMSGTDYDLSPGLPTKDIDSTGLSALVHITLADLTQPHSFRFNLKLKGSKQLSFVPLSGNSQFTLQSAWKNPSFDGNKIPDSREVSENGFTATWLFNKANLPFGTVLKDISFKKEDFAFGVTMIQPADQYAKTDRCVKYALLFIGLSFALFFITELLQKNPLHPVQYIMVGIALVIFFSLLLSVSEFILFNYAYLIASSATIGLITLYAKGHFKTWRIASVFAVVLSALYGFIFILIQLEDTALLLGSIGLFLVLAAVMYASRKINWYNISSN